MHVCACSCVQRKQRKVSCCGVAACKWLRRGVPLAPCPLGCWSDALLKAASRAAPPPRLQPAFWVMGNLGRAGYMRSTGGMWPYRHERQAAHGTVWPARRCMQPTGYL